MASAFSDTIFSASVGVVEAGVNGSTEQASMKVCSQSIPRGNSSPDLVLNIQEFESACSWLEKKTLIGYFVGRTPPESMLWEWMAKSCTPQGIQVEGIQRLTKGFFLFHFGNPSQTDHIFIHGPWTVRSSLLVFQRWSRDFSVSDDNKLRVLIWVEFLGLPIPCWSFLQAIVQTLGKVISVEPDKCFNVCPQQRVCVEVDLSRDLKDSMEIHIGATTFTQKVLYLNLLNTCYRCQFADHKIKDCPLLERNHTPAPESKPTSNPKKDEWTTVVKKDKGTVKVGSLPQDHSHPSSSGTPLAPAVPVVPLLMSPPNSNLGSQGMLDTRPSDAEPTWVRAPLTTSMISSQSLCHSRNPEGWDEVSDTREK